MRSQETLLTALRKSPERQCRTQALSPHLHQTRETPDREGCTQPHLSSDSYALLRDSGGRRKVLPAVGENSRYLLGILRHLPSRDRRRNFQRGSFIHQIPSRSLNPWERTSHELEDGSDSSSRRKILDPRLRGHRGCRSLSGRVHQDHVFHFFCLRRCQPTTSGREDREGDSHTAGWSLFRSEDRKAESSSSTLSIMHSHEEAVPTAPRPEPFGVIYG